jgi:hypothetical protein
MTTALVAQLAHDQLHDADVLVVVHRRGLARGHHTTSPCRPLLSRYRPMARRVVVDGAVAAESGSPWP